MSFDPIMLALCRSGSGGGAAGELGLPVLRGEDLVADMGWDGTFHDCPAATAEILERCMTQGLPCVLTFDFEAGYNGVYLVNFEAFLNADMELEGIGFSQIVGKVSETVFLMKITCVKSLEEGKWQYSITGVE